MATKTVVRCVSCGKEALARDRRNLKEDNVSSAVIKLLTKRLTSKNVVFSQENLQNLVYHSYLCRNCFNGYKSYIDKEKCLYEINNDSISFIEQQLYIFNSTVSSLSLDTSQHAVTCTSDISLPAPSTLTINSSTVSPSVTIPLARKRLYTNRNTTTPSASLSPTISPKVILPYPSGTKVLRVGKFGKRITKAIVRSKCPEKSTVKAILLNTKSRYWVVSAIGKVLLYEVKKLSSLNAQSIMRRKDADSIRSFPWESLKNEFTTDCPTLLQLLLSSTAKESNDNHQIYVIISIICILCRYRCPKMSLFQKFISMMLYAGHAGTKVYDILNKLNLCVGKTSSYNLVSLLGHDHDKHVNIWMESLLLKVDFHSPVKNTPMTVVDLDNGDNNIDSDNDDDIHDTLNSSINSSDSGKNSGYINSCDHSTTSSECNPLTPEAPAFSYLSDESVKAGENCGIELLCPLSCSNVVEQEKLNVDEEWCGFKLVGDNIDKAIKRRHIRVDRHTETYHGFHYYAIKDRINLSHVSDEPKAFFYQPVSELPIYDIPPSDADHITLHHNFAIHISRILVQELQYFAEAFGTIVTRHIKHQYSEEMSQKSQTVPLGIINKNENLTEDMVDILLEIHKYVPTKHEMSHDTVSQKQLVKEEMHTILIGGDQLTRKRMETAKDMRRNSTTPTTRLQGLMPVCEDWHTKGIFLEVVWKYFYKTTSFMEQGTMCQLRNAIDRRNVSASADKDFHACDDFFNLVTRAHVVAAAMKFLKMDNVSDFPIHPLLAEDLWIEGSDANRKDILLAVCKEIVAEFINIEEAWSVKDDDGCSLVIDDDFYNNENENDEEDKHKNNREHNLDANNDDNSGTDQVLLYASKVMSMGLIYTEFCDSIREGDGLRILRCWRYLLIIFKVSQRRNYAIEALNLLAQYHFFLSPRQAEQLIWCRCVNTCGREGQNIACDLLMEHLNRSCKMCVGSYNTSNTLTRAGNCLGAILQLENNFHNMFPTTNRSGKHAVPNSNRDFKITLGHLLEKDVFKFNKGRQHNSFKKITKDNGIDSKKMYKWMKGHISNLKEVIYS